MKSKKFKQGAYTVVELMIVAGIIVVIAGIGIPAWKRARESARKAAVINEIRQNADAFQNYATDHVRNPLPPGPAVQQIPNGMASYMPQKSTWTTSPQGGGYWIWFPNPNPTADLPFSGYILLTRSGLAQEQLQDIDSLLDDGNLDTGSLRQSDQTLYYGIQ